VPRRGRADPAEEVQVVRRVARLVRAPAVAPVSGRVARRESRALAVGKAVRVPGRAVTALPEAVRSRVKAARIREGK
jgi:hypothetical protein